MALKEKEWQVIYELAVSQTVEALVYDGVMRLDKNLFPSEELLLHWTVRVDAIERRNRQMAHIIRETGQLFQDEGADFLLLKGHTLALCYPLPLHRSSGDIDYYFTDKSAFRQMNRRISEKNISVKRGALYSVYYRWKGFDIEHHTRLMDLVNPASQRFLACLVKQEEDRRQAIRFGDITLSTLSPLLTHVHTNAHILKHFIGYGIGLRQFCDMARICFTYHDQVQGERLALTYKKLGISRWSMLLYSFLVEYLGLSERYLPFPLTKKLPTDWLAAEVLQAGNFGFFTNKVTGHTWKVEKAASRTLQTRQFVRHFFQALRYAPGETIAFPLSKMWSAASYKTIK